MRNVIKNFRISLLGNLLTGKGAIAMSQGQVITTVGEGTIRAGKKV